MKKLILFIALLLPLFVNAQAHLGSTLSDLKAYHSDKEFRIRYSEDRTKYAYSNMHYGTYYYYFDDATGYSNICMQVPVDDNALKAQIETYNKKYVKVTENKWQANLEDGGKMLICLELDEEEGQPVFYYTNNRNLKSTVK